MRNQCFTFSRKQLFFDRTPSEVIRNNQQRSSHQTMALPLRRESLSSKSFHQPSKTPQPCTSSSHISEIARHSLALHKFLTNGRLIPLQPIPFTFTVDIFENRLTIHYSLIETPSRLSNKSPKGRMGHSRDGNTSPSTHCSQNVRSLNPTAKPFLPTESPNLNTHHSRHSNNEISTQTPKISVENFACQTETPTSESSTQTPSPSTCHSAIQVSTPMITTSTQTRIHTTDSHTQTTYSVQTSSCQTDITSSSITSLYNEIKELKTNIHEYKDKNIKLHNLATKLVKRPQFFSDTVNQFRDNFLQAIFVELQKTVDTFAKSHPQLDAYMCRLFSYNDLDALIPWIFIDGSS
mmetsp:Transcript_5186/g.6496  ORF Transcript_5186/g.6496 Transcript_5186/m.6496 type:complete len:350 (+) Transcript_5186:24-1073(+)